MKSLIKTAYKKLLDIMSPELIPHPKNMNQHPPEQIRRLAELIKYQGQRWPVMVSNRSGFIVAGHGRLEALKLLQAELGWDKVAVDFQDFESEAQEYAFMVSDNAIQEWAELDLSMITSEATNLGPSLNLDMLGIRDFQLDESLLDQENPYTRKVESPIYLPSGECPLLPSIYDTTKTDELIKEIDHHDLPSDIKIFLKLAAHRHTQFNYKYVAEYYAHASPLVQKLMEKSALVIIDFDSAIENGFVKLTKDLQEEYRNGNVE